MSETDILKYGLCGCALLYVAVMVYFMVRMEIDHRAEMKRLKEEGEKQY